MTDTRADVNSGPGVLALIGGWGLALAAWGLHLAISYSIVEWYCNRGGNVAPQSISLVLNIVALCMLVIAGAGLYLAWRNWRAVRQLGHEASSRSRFLAAGGPLISALMLGVIVMQSIPNLVLSPCQ
ncbi:hypothetical protein HG264_03370 [Pseudomonas sp. gcc21]|uniref:hypothetical protein n=1 Tax=Pseudomonas sp. gcc21 TaxID=2726989 RepID=UPI00145139DF|nr:hypothetical protein [Pseudomonas sp. gcc21]QJD58013.1 hypothetical protein HG264_03370 [Pseudomonas sp. gcc21]